MRTTKFFLGALGLLTLGLVACSDHDFVPQDQQVEYDQTRYISVQISSPNDASRADFDDGTTNESFVSRIDFLFYDAAGNPTSAPQTMANLQGTFTDIKENGNVTRLYTSVVPVNLVQGQNLPSQVVCIINGNQANIEVLKTVTLAELIDVERNYFRQGDYFVMTNSVYYGQDALTGQANQRICATPINANMQLFGTKQEAENAINNATTNPGALVDIYVERVAAKVGLTMAATAPQEYKLANGDTEAADDEVTLTFKATYWAMNATSQNTYLTKRYGVEAEDVINYYPTFAEITALLVNKGGFTNWNDEPNHRSYWGCSPSYFKNEYPNVSDDVKDKELDNVLSYYTYKEIVEQAARTEAQAGKWGIAKQALAAASDGSFSIVNTGDHTTGFIYTRESTVALRTITDIQTGNPAAAVASAVIVGQYTVNGATTPATFYIDRNTNNTGTYYANADNVKEVLAERQFIVFTDDNGLTSAPAARFELVHPSTATQDIAKVNLASRLVTLQLDKNNLSETNKLYYYDASYKAEGSTETGAYVEITTANIDAVNAQLLSVGYMDMFKDGKAFFSIPIRHLNWSDDYYVQETWTEEVDNGDGTTTTVTYTNPVGRYDWASMKTGALGVVRNHVYNLTVNSITGLGSAISDDDNPIVPPKEDNNQYVAARINILSWKIANTWSVDL